ncbi:hypothetical protein [Vulcanisaeta sp. JCM 16161]|uniref:hypothetical protein n=1 Tax=Vulcanisaeta sp. JCM 16161 TaxID=1295372 RepID=UPI0006D0DDD9|nr:hypothetical protein [Vulcanisaeta sp. JCM 16161]
MAGNPRVAGVFSRGYVKIVVPSRGLVIEVFRGRKYAQEIRLRGAGARLYTEAQVIAYTPEVPTGLLIDGRRASRIRAWVEAVLEPYADRGGWTVFDEELLEPIIGEIDEVLKEFLNLSQ